MNGVNMTCCIKHFECLSRLEKHYNQFIHHILCVCRRPDGSKDKRLNGSLMVELDWVSLEEVHENSAVDMKSVRQHHECEAGHQG